jgi:hypothetical protein
MSKPTIHQSNEPNVIADRDQFRQLAAKQFSEALATLMGQFPQVRSLALIVDWDDSLPAALPLAWKTKPGHNGLHDLVRILQRTNEASVLFARTVEQQMKGAISGEAERGGAGIRNGGVYPAGVEQRGEVHPERSVREGEAPPDSNTGHQPV